MEVSILSSHRSIPPSGLNGGGDGELGRTEVRRLGGKVEELGHADQTTVSPGEAVIVTTPTAGRVWGVGCISPPSHLSEL